MQPAKVFIDNAKVMAKGQITLPKDIRDILGITCGDRVTFVVDGNEVKLVNSALFAMQMLQKNMTDEAQCVGLNSDDDIMALVKQIRSEDNVDERAD